MKIKFVIKHSESFIKDYIKNKYNISSRIFQKLVSHNCIKIDGIIYDKKIHFGNVTKPTTVEIDFGYAEDNSNIVPTKMDLDIIYEDNWLLIINKPCGIAIHPSILHYNNSLSNGIKFYFDKINLQKKIRPVNRIDIGTSGIVVFAKCDYIHSVLSMQMENKQFVKKYLALVSGILEEKSGTIDLPISRKEGSIIERCVIPNKGQKSITHYKVLKELDNCSLVELLLETGRTHQIRVHMSAVGHPVLGDSLYGNKLNAINGQALHSYYVEFSHPITNKKLSFTCKPNWNNLNLI